MGEEVGEPDSVGRHQVKVSAVIVINPIDDEVADALLSALKPELLTEMRGVKTTVRKVGRGTLEISIEALTYSAFRAAVNSSLRLIDTALRLLEKVRV